MLTNTLKRNFSLKLISFIFPFYFLILHFLIQKTNSIQIKPDEYLEFDNVYLDDIENPLEQYHHIISARASKQEYHDYYKGISYRNDLYCYYEKDTYGFHPYGSHKDLSSYYPKFENLNQTRLPGLLKYGCYVANRPFSILLNLIRYDPDATITLTIRFSNIHETDNATFALSICNYFIPESQLCTSDQQILDPAVVVPNNTFLLYEFKFNTNGYYLQSENFTVFHTISGFTFPNKNFVHLFMQLDKKSPQIYMNSYIISIDIFIYVLSLGGSTHNKCNNAGCISNWYTTSNTHYYDCYNGHYTSMECSLRGCIPGSFCDDHNVCEECDYQCRTCFNAKAMNCRSCYSTAIFPQWKYYITDKYQSGCTFEFYPLNKAEDVDIEFPIPLNYRFTFEFWIFIFNPLHLTNQELIASLSSFILKDFFTVSLHQNPDTQNSTFFILTPFEKNYPFKEDYIVMDKYYSTYKKIFPTLQYLKVEVFNCTSKWVYIKGGISYTHKKMFLNGESQDLNYLPVYYGDDTTTYKFFTRKFYRENSYTNFRIQGFSYLNTDIYVRNFNFYSEYMDNFVNSPNYFNMFEIPNILVYPQLLFVIPFVNVTVDSSSKKVYYNVYDYSGQFNDLKINEDINAVQITSIESNWVRDTLAPRKNFYRLNFLSFKNAEYSTLDLLSQSQTISCGGNNQYCYENDNPYICAIGNLLPNISEMNASFCLTNCEIDDVYTGETHKFMRLPNIKNNQETNASISNNICSYECNKTEVDNCPSQSSSNIKSFTCNQTGYYNYFYQCLNETEYPPAESALQFSGELNTKSIYFPFNKELENFMIEIWFHVDLLHQENPPLVDKYIFMTNNHQIYYDSNAQAFKLKVFVGTAENKFDLGQKIYYYGWNHLIFHSHGKTTKGKTQTTFSFSITNLFVDVGTITGKSTANKLCFCNSDTLCCDRTSNAVWFNMFIREIKVWDERYVNLYTLIDFNKFNYVIPAGLLQLYNLTYERINYNVITDDRHPNDNTYNAYFPFDIERFNPDDDMNYNIGFNFNWNDLNYPKYIISTELLRDQDRVRIVETNNCYEGCEKCFGYNKFACFSCQHGFALNTATCTQTSEDTSTYYYINPLFKNATITTDAELELDFNSLNLDTYNTISLFFYIKIYGYTQDQYDLYSETRNSPLFKIITFSESDNFILCYDKGADTLLLNLGGEKQFSYTGVVEKYGMWVPISISAFRSSDTNFQKHFVSMTFETTLLPYLGFDTNNNYKYFPFKTFKLSKYLIAHVAHVTLYDLFIVNAFGYAVHKDNVNGIFSFNSDISRTNLIIKEFKLYNETSNTTLDIGNSCVLPTDIIDNANGDILARVKCVEDYISYTDQKCDDDQLVEFTTQNLPGSCYSNPSKCDNIKQVIKRMTTNCDYLYATCDTKSTNSINNLIFTYTPKNSDTYIVCGDANGLDLARFEPGTIWNIDTPTEEFKLEFWFLSQSYVGNNFGEIVVEWQDRVKISVSYDSVAGDYVAKCIPMNDDANELSFHYVEATHAQNRWRYIVCGVNAVTNEAYITNLMKENRVERTFSPNSNLQNDGNSSLYIAENSRTNFGVSYVKELRLWNCYSCASDRAFVTYSRDDDFFKNVTNYFKFDSPTGYLVDLKTGYENVNASYQFITKTDFNGYGLLDPIPETPNCNEGGQLYFSIKMGEGCDTMFNFNIFPKDIVFDDIPASRSNSYTMDFWFYVESANNFTEGMNIIYEDHMAISTFASDVSSTDLTVYCFPQAYRDKLEGVFGNDIDTKYNEAQNKIKYTFVDGFSKWNYVRCSYSYELLKYYINDETPLDIDPEIYFGSTKNDKPFKKFMDNKAKLRINISRNNFVRIIIQTINIYRDYMPQTIITKYKKMYKFITDSYSNVYFPILFSVDFKEGYDVITNKLKYYFNDPDTADYKSPYYTNFLINLNQKSYDTYPIYDPFLQCDYGQYYDSGSASCKSIMTPNNCDKVKTFCTETSKFFWCKKGLYLDINTLQCNKDCPADYTKRPDYPDGYGICYIKASDKHYNTWPYSNADLAQGTFENKFSCISGYTLVNYNCIPDSKIANSGLYISSKYSFSNFFASYNKLGILNYYVDFWFLFDLTEDYRFNIADDETRYTIFIAYPHFITRYKNKIQYNNAYILLDYHDIISVDQIKLQWNHVVIENYKVPGNIALNTYNYVNIYLNNDYGNPAFSMSVQAKNDYSLAQIAFCHIVNKNYSTCNLGLDATTYKVFSPYWEDAFYKEIKVWNRNSTALSTLNTFGSSLNNKITMNVISYHPLTADTIQPGKIKSLVQFNGNDVDFVFKYNLEKSYDNSIQVNFATDYDITLPNNYIESVDVSSYISQEKTSIFSRSDTSYIVNQCNSNCYKCFNSVSDCITCQDPYLLTGTKCVDNTGNYFKTPSGDRSTNPTIKLNDDFSSYNEITIMFYMKFMGSIDQREGIVPIVYFYDNLNYLGWHIKNESFVINVRDSSSAQEENIYFYENSRNNVAKWSYYSISILKSSYVGKFPYMIQFMVDTNVLKPEYDMVKLKKKLINFNYLQFNNQIISIFYDLRIYNKFLISSFGLAQQGISSIQNIPLIKNYLLKSTSSTSNNCISSSDITPSLSSSDIACEGDYNPFDDSTLVCTSNENLKLINALNNNITCGNCENYCDSYCISNTTYGCTCTHDSGNYWIRYNFENDQKFYCERPDSLNVNEYQDITIDNIDVGSETSYMIEFWFFAHSYLANSNFPGVTIIWEHYIKVSVTFYTNEYLQISCYPYSDGNTCLTEKSEKFNNWVFFRCQVDKEKKRVTGNKGYLTLDSSYISSWETNQQSTSTRLIVKNNAASDPYGIFLLRELRLWNKKKTGYENNQHTNLDATSYSSLIHYFKCNFTSEPYRQRDFYDTKTQTSYPLTRILSNYPYSYLPNNYINLILCEPSYDYKLTPEGTYECMKQSDDDIIDNIKKDETILTPYELKELITGQLSSILNVSNYTIGINSTTSNFIFDKDGNLSINDPVVSDIYCNSKGMRKLVDKSVACYCTGDTVGKHCQVPSSKYANKESMYETVFEKRVKDTYDNYIKSNIGSGSQDEQLFIDALNMVIKSNQLTTKEASFSETVINWLSSDVIYNIKKCNVEYIKIVDELYSTMILLVNTYKAGLMSSGKGSGRNVDLNDGQEEEIQPNMATLKKLLEYLTSLCFTDTVNGEWEYTSENLKVNLYKFIKKDAGNLDNIIKNEKFNNYEPFVQFGDCIDTIKSADSSSKYVNLQLITWYYSPYYYSNTLNKNYTSNYMILKLYSDKIDEVGVDECKKGNIVFHLTLTNPVILDIIKNNKEHFIHENIYKSSDRIFTEPIYINNDGSISDVTLEERFKKYYFEYLLIFKYFDATQQNLSPVDMEYYTLEDRFYFKCTSEHLSEFLLVYEYNPLLKKKISRFYFLKHPKIYFNSKNFKGNYGFVFIIIILVLYTLNFGIVKLCLISRKKKLGGKNYLLIEEFLIDYVYPYGNLEGEFFVNKENLNKIYDDDIDDDDKPKKNEKKIISPKNKRIVKNKISDDDDLIDVKNFEELTRNKGGLDFGDMKNKKVYQNYYQQFSKHGYIEEEEKKSKIKNDKNKASKMDNKKQTITGEDEEFIQDVKTTKEFEKKNSTVRTERNNLINSYDKEDKNNDGKNRDVNIYNRKRELLSNKIDLKNLKHSLQIYNEDFRCRNLSQMNVNCCKFLCINLKNRIIFINTFRGNYTYSASVKALCFPLYLTILMFVNTFVYICLEDEMDYMTFIKTNLIGFIWRCLLPIIVVNLYFYFSRCIYNTDNGQMRTLLYEFKTSKKYFDRDYAAFLKKIKIMKIVETVIYGIMIVLLYIFVFGLYTVFVPQGKIMIVSLLCGIAGDLVLCFLFELFIAMLYVCRKSSVLVVLLDKLNRLQSYKMLSP